MKAEPKPEFRGVWIPKKIWQSEDLTWMEKCLLAEIEFLDNDYGCFASNEFLAKRFGSTPESMRVMICRLKKEGWLIDRGGEGIRKISVADCKKKPVMPVTDPVMPVTPDRNACYGNGGGSYKGEIPVEIPKEIPASLSLSFEEEKKPSIEPEEIYEAYPKKVAKPEALKAIKKALKKVDASTLLEKTKAYAETVNGSDRQFVPNPATWFNGERYNDSADTWAVKSFASANHRNQPVGLPTNADYAAGF